MSERYTFINVYLSDTRIYLTWKTTYLYYIVRCSKFECREDIHFETQPGPVAKNATLRSPVVKWTRALWISRPMHSTVAFPDTTSIKLAILRDGGMDVSSEEKLSLSVLTTLCFLCLQYFALVVLHICNFWIFLIKNVIYLVSRNKVDRIDSSTQESVL